VQSGGRVGRSFSSRNPVPIGAVGLVLLVVSLVAAFNAAKLPLIGGGTEYTAYFTDSANLKSDDGVEIAGVKVGRVQDVVIDTEKALVKVTFTVKDGWVGNESTIDIKIKTLLGAKYLSIESIGGRAQNPDDVISVERTTTPFDIYPAFTALAGTVGDLDTGGLADAFRTMSDDFAGTPDSVRPVIRGLTKLSTTIADRDSRLRTLLVAANRVSGTLADRDQELTRLLRDGNLVLGELDARRDAIHALLLSTATLSAQLRGLVADNQKTIGPLLASLDKILALLQNNEDSLDRGLALMAPFYRVFNNVVGNGSWFDGYIQNLSVCGVFSVALKTTSC
jgi:phospholipid/cholesterol/gamma-HCH transport system substrate-binding protein